MATRKQPVDTQNYSKYLLENIDSRLSKIEKILSRLRLSDVSGATEKRKTRPEILILKAENPFEGFNWYPSSGNVIWNGPASLSTMQLSIDRADPKLCELNYTLANKKVEIINIFVDGASVKFQNDPESGVLRFVMDQDTSITGETELGILVNTTVSAKVNTEASQVFWVGIGLKNLTIAPSVR
jgi:hypothetical protein